MKGKTTQGRLLLCSVLCSVLLIFADSSQADDRAGNNAERRQTLVFCKVSDKPKKHIKQLQPILDYVVSNLGHVGITKGEVVFARDNRQLLNYIRQGKVDWITETPFSAAIFEQKGGAETILLRWKKGVPLYHTLFVTRKDSGIKGIADLKGKMVAVEDRGSTSGFLLPVSTMIQNNLQVTEMTSPRESVPAGMAGYVFAKQEMNIAHLVYRGITEAGAFSNLDWDDYDRVNEQIRSELVVFHKTQDVPRSLELVRGSLAREVKDALKNVLLKAAADPEAKEALKAYKNTTKFEEIDSQTEERMQTVRELARIIQSELMLF